MGQAASPTEHWMIGGMFLEHFVTIFDFDNARIGFAEPEHTAYRFANNLTNLWAKQDGPPLVMERLHNTWMAPVIAITLVCSTALAGICFMAARWRFKKSLVHGDSSATNLALN